MVTLDKDGLADIVPTTTDSYTRNEQWELAQKGIEESERLGRSMLNGYPMVNYGVGRARELIEAIDKPAIMLTGTTMPRLTERDRVRRRTTADTWAPASRTRRPTSRSFRSRTASATTSTSTGSPRCTPSTASSCIGGSRDS